MNNTSSIASYYLWVGGGKLYATRDMVAPLPTVFYTGYVEAKDVIAWSWCYHTLTFLPRHESVWDELIAIICGDARGQITAHLC